MSNTKTLYFDIEGITCTSCTGIIRDGLLKDKEVKDTSLNLATKRARVVVEEEISPQEIIDRIANIDSKFIAKWLPPEDEKTFYFSIRGMTSTQDAQKIKAKLEQHKEDINTYTVNYSTGVAELTTFTPRDPEKIQVIETKLQSIIEAAIEGQELKANSFSPEIKDAHSQENNSSQYRRRALINALVGIPLLLLSGFIPLPLTIAGQFVGLFIGGVIFGVMWKTGKEFYKGAWDKLVNERKSDMNTLIALGTGTAWIYSMMIALAPWLLPVTALQYHFLAINMILGIVNLGKGLRANAEQQTKNKVQRLAQVYVNLQPQYAKVLNQPFAENEFIVGAYEHCFKEIHYRQIKEGDIIQVLKDQRVPVEGVIISEGTEISVNEETLTGEPEGCKKKKGADVFSGTLNLSETFYIRATRSGKEGHLTRVIDDVNKSSASKPKSISKLVDRIAVVFVPMILCIAGLSALGWYALGPAPVLPWIIKSVLSVLLCACPCALGLATPLAIAICMYMLFNKKILVHDASALEIAAQANTVVFDKTGTLTHPGVHHVFVAENMPGWTKESVIQYAASVEKSIDHPIAKSFMTENSSHDILPCENAKKDDEGVSGDVDEAKVIIGSYQYMETQNVLVTPACKEEESNNEKNGMSSVYVAINGECVAVVAFKHQIRKDAKKTIDDLIARDIDIFILTGDQEEPAKAVAKELGIKKVYARRGSQAKKEFILDLKRRHQVVIYVGDGVNDIQAMEAADLGIAVGSWTHASSVAKVATQQLNFIPFLIMAKETMNNILQNLYWTGFYNLLSLTAATGLLYYAFNFVLNPVVASGLMALSSISVVVNSMRLTHGIQRAMDVYEGKIQPPRTFIEKIKRFIPFQGLYEVLRTAFSSPQSDEVRQNAERNAASLHQLLGSRKDGERSSPPGSPIRSSNRFNTRGGQYMPIIVEDRVIKKEPETTISGPLHFW